MSIMKHSVHMCSRQETPGRLQSLQVLDNNVVKKPPLPTPRGKGSNRPMHLWENPQILEPLFNVLPLTQLKLCRQVNRAWNEILCSILQRKSHVNLICSSCNELKLTEFWILYQRNQILFKSVSPFKRYIVSIQVMQDELIDTLMDRSSTEIIGVNYSTDRDITYYSKYLRNFLSILREQYRTLKSLTYTFTNFEPKLRDGGWKEEELNLPQLQLPALEAFHFYNWSYGPLGDSMSFRIFLYRIFLAAPNLRTFSTNTDHPTLLNRILSRNLFKNGEGLFIKKFTPSSFPYLSEAKFKNLKSLGLILSGVSHLSLSTLAPLLQQVAGTLEEFAISSVLATTDPEEAFPYMPNLRKILLCRSSIDLQCLNPEIVPKLKSIYLLDFQLHAENRADYFDSSALHEGVEEIVVKCSSTIGQPSGALSNSCQNYDVSLLAFLYRQFPNVISFHLAMSKFTKRLVHAVIRFFPDIQALTLENMTAEHFPEDVFSGVSSNDRKRSSSSCLNEDHRIKPCLLDMTCLRELKLKWSLDEQQDAESSPSQIITANSIKLGLGEIPSLVILEINKYQGLQTRLIQKYLGHLSSIKIWSLKGSTLLNEDTLLLRTPNVTILHPPDGEQTLADMFSFSNYH